MEIPHHTFGANPQIEHVELVADIPSAGDENAAIERFEPLFLPLFDRMQFDMGSPLDAQTMTMIDVTPPVLVGDQRPFFQWTSPPFNRWLEANMPPVQASPYGELPESVQIENSKVAGALRWYVKAQSANLLHDRFIFLWIALETLRKITKFQVREPLILRCCNHEIAKCPRCEEPTTDMVFGLTMRKFLQRGGVDDAQAHHLWRMRQMMHGEIPFDSKKLEKLPVLVQPLRAVVAAGLKDVLGKAADESPVVAMSGVPFPAVALTLTTSITEEHLRPLIPDSPTVEEEVQG